MFGRRPPDIYDTETMDIGQLAESCNKDQLEQIADVVRKEAM